MSANTLATCTSVPPANTLQFRGLAQQVFSTLTNYNLHCTLPYLFPMQASEKGVIYLGLGLSAFPELHWTTSSTSGKAPSWGSSRGSIPDTPLCHGRRGPSSSGQDTVHPAQVSAVGVLQSTALWRFALLLFPPAPSSLASPCTQSAEQTCCCLLPARETRTWVLSCSVGMVAAEGRVLWAFPSMVFCVTSHLYEVSSQSCTCYRNTLNLSSSVYSKDWMSKYLVQKSSF